MSSISAVRSPPRPPSSPVGKSSSPVRLFALTFSSTRQRRRRPQSLLLPDAEKFSDSGGSNLIERRSVVFSSIGMVAAAFCNASKDGISLASQFTDSESFPSSPDRKDLRVGDGPKPKVGETVAVDWDGYTIGYLGRIFEAGSFEGDDKAFFKIRVGSQEVIPAFEEAITGMALGGIRRIVVPPELGYPENDCNKSAPRPTTFSEQ